MGDDDSFWPELHLLLAANHSLKTASSPTATIHKFDPDVFSNRCRHYFTVWKQLYLSNGVTRIEDFLPQVLVDVLQQVIASEIKNHADRA